MAGIVLGAWVLFKILRRSVLGQVNAYSFCYPWARLVIGIVNGINRAVAFFHFSQVAQS
jgi:hypothetical protein